MKPNFPRSWSLLRACCVELIGALAAKLKSGKGIVLAFLAVTVLTGSIELGMGRSLLGPDGQFGLWEGNIMLIHPLDAIKAWPMTGQPPP